MNKFAPIYNAIDDENYRFAIQIIDKALKKNPLSNDVPTLQALKALSLVRSGSYQEGYNLAYSVKQMKPSDPYTVQALFLAFKMLKMNDDIIDLYSNAYELSPNEEWANHWFMGLARKGDYKILQQAAVKINKEFKSDKYYFWVVVSIYLQSMEKKSSNPKLQLTLAERMMDKALKEFKEFNYEAAQLFLDILKDQGKYQAALDLVQGPLKSVYKVEYERKKVCIEYFIKLNDYDNIVEYSMNALRENPEDWSVHEALLVGVAHKNVENVLEFYKELQDLASKDKYLKRGPFLGEFYYRIQSGAFDGIVDLIMTFIDNFGSTQSCFDDLFPRLHAIPEEHVPTLVERIYSILDLKIKQVKLNINCIKLLRFFKFEMNDEFNPKKLIVAYNNSLKIKVTQTKERQHGDDYLIVASHYYLDDYITDRTNLTSLYNAIAILEFGLLNSKYNYIITLLLVRLYFEIGAANRALDLADTLDIKQVQLDTISYLYTDGLEYFGNLDRASYTFNNALNIYFRNEIETPEMILQAFKFGTFSKIPEFINFQNRLTSSVQRAITNRQILRIEYLSPSNWLQMEDRIQNTNIEDLSPDGTCPYLNIDELYDNRDTSLVARYTAGDSTFLQDLKGEKFPLDVKNPEHYWLKLYTFVPMILNQMFSGKNSHGSFNSVADFQDFVAKTSMTSLESLGARILLEFYKVSDEFPLNAGAVASLHAELNDQLVELQNIINSKSFIPASSFCKSMTLLLEAYNIACIFTVREKDRQWKTELTRQLKALKQSLSKANSRFNVESVSSIKSNFDGMYTSLASTTSAVELIKRSWIITISGFSGITDGRLGILSSFK
ncbi:N-alpha-acetyltransferase 25, NatB auxiliary subunit [Boothiomyces sp. JEL0838]|nr:N-alpha-acetyltransferase 25, NatB auxiliary subunit [Boothiomyces sp. JEL0838]